MINIHDKLFLKMLNVFQRLKLLRRLYKGRKKRDNPTYHRVRRNLPTGVEGFHATAGWEQLKCAMTRFLTILLPVAVAAPAVAICLNSLLKHGIRNPETETEYGIRERRFEAINLKKNVSNDNKITQQIKKKKDIDE